MGRIKTMGVIQKVDSMRKGEAEIIEKWTKTGGGILACGYVHF